MQSLLSIRNMLSVVMTIFVCAGITAFQPGCGVSKDPSIFLITVDTLRHDHLSCYGYDRDTSPHLNIFAGEAMLFENCLAHAPDTRMSLASLMTGFLPHETKVLQGSMLPPSVETLAEILQTRGYRTAAVVSNYVRRRNGGWEQGFEIYDDTMNDLELVRRCPERVAEHTTNRAIELLDELGREQLFLWVHYQDPHGPYSPPERLRQKFLTGDSVSRRLAVNYSLSGKEGIPFYQVLGEQREQSYYISQYDAEIRYQDEQLKRLFDVMKEKGLYETSLIIFTADHGESMGEHDYYFAHGEYLYANQIHVPLIIKQGKKLTGRRMDIVQHLDVVPTVWQILGLPVDGKLRGRDIRHPITEEREIFSEMRSMFEKEGVGYSLVRDGLKLIYTRAQERYELYDLVEDPDEIRDLTKEEEYKEVLQDLSVRLHRISEEEFLGLKAAPMHRNLTDEEKNKLRSLGYIE